VAVRGGGLKSPVEKCGGGTMSVSTSISWQSAIHVDQHEGAP
jgi:hypothetical protein